MGLVGELELETLTTNHLLSYIIHDTLTASPANICSSPPHQITNLPLENTTPAERRRQAAAGGKRKRHRRAKACKNKDEAESQRMTHIVVERNRRKLMNEHLAILKSLMPKSYIQRGDQASIVGGAIEYVKELEHLLQTLEAQKLLLYGVSAMSSFSGDLPPPPPFSQFFLYPQYTWTTMNNNANDENSNVNMTNSMVDNNTYKYTVTSSSSTRSPDVADIEVSLIETHANVRILSRRSFSQLTKMVEALQSLSLSILHLNVTTVDPLVLYSISVKVEEGCQLTSADEIAGAVHHMLKIILDEIGLC